MGKRLQVDDRCTPGGAREGSGVVCGVSSGVGRVRQGQPRAAACAMASDNGSALSRRGVFVLPPMMVAGFAG